MQRILSRPMASPPPRVPVPRNGVDYRGKVVLAPMVRSGELPTRLLSLKYGADLVWGMSSFRSYMICSDFEVGPETVDKSLIGTTRIINPFTQTVDFIRRSNKGSQNPITTDQTIRNLPNPSLRKAIPRLPTRHLITFSCSPSCLTRCPRCCGNRCQCRMSETLFNNWRDGCCSPPNP